MLEVPKNKKGKPLSSWVCHGYAIFPVPAPFFLPSDPNSRSSCGCCFYPISFVMLIVPIWRRWIKLMAEQITVAELLKRTEGFFARKGCPSQARRGANRRARFALPSQSICLCASTTLSRKGFGRAPRACIARAAREPLQYIIGSVTGRADSASGPSCNLSRAPKPSSFGTYPRGL
jgi:hypothetical protein